MTSATSKCENQLGLVLHVRAFTDSKKIIELFTRSAGRISAVYRISKRNKAPANFTEYELTWFGKGSLKTLSSAETLKPVLSLSGNSLFCSIYLNELLLRLLSLEEPFESVYECYLETILKLSQSDNNAELQQVLLRRFEMQLLQALGLGLDFYKTFDGQDIVDDDRFYQLRSSQGFVQVESDGPNDSLYSAQSLTDIRTEKWNREALRAAKRLCREQLRPLLGDKPIKARELFI